MDIPKKIAQRMYKILNSETGKALLLSREFSTPANFQKILPIEDRFLSQKLWDITSTDESIFKFNEYMKKADWVD